MQLWLFDYAPPGDPGATGVCALEEARPISSRQPVSACSVSQFRRAPSQRHASDFADCSDLEREDLALGYSMVRSHQNLANQRLADSCSSRWEGT
jgi:hypothetical protein